MPTDSAKIGVILTYELAGYFYASTYFAAAATLVPKMLHTTKSLYLYWSL